MRHALSLAALILVGCTPTQLARLESAKVAASDAYDVAAVARAQQLGQCADPAEVKRLERLLSEAIRNTRHTAPTGEAFDTDKLLLSPQ